MFLVISQKTIAVVDITKLKLEVKVLARMKHKHIMVLYDFFEEQDNYIIVTELIEGGDVLSRLRSKNSYTEKDARDLFVTLTRAVQYMHRQDVVHRDLKVLTLLG